MHNRVPMLLGALAGAVVGATCGYLYFTDEGRRLRADLEPTIEELTREWRRATAAASRAKSVTADVAEFRYPG